MSNDSAGRDEFEEWCRSENICIDRDPADHGVYTFNMVQHRWQAWQAALSRQSAQGAEAVAWKSKTPCFKQYVTDAWYRGQPYEIRKWYEPFTCATCDDNDTVPRTELDQYRKDAERCREAISAALRIKELWLPEVCDSEHQAECQALHAMHDLFGRAMQEGK